VETQDDDVNSWGIRAGWVPAIPGPPLSDLDGVAGSGDEITTGIQQTPVLHSAGLDNCTTFYEYVRPGQATTSFHNYDLDAPVLAARVRYYPPSASYDPLAIAGGLPGTASGSSLWNNGTSLARLGGDTFNNPEPGWWRIVTCTYDLFSQNQLIQEGQTDQASYLSQPGTPALDLSVTPSAATALAGDSVAFTVSYTNTSSGITAGAAVGTTFSVTLPSDLTFVSCVGAATCTQAGSTLTVTLGTVAAGASGAVTIHTTASAAASGAVGLSLLANYSDVLGNPFEASAGAIVIIN
jgi:uncharacterized repeat protein (TIGR01451 family)